MNFFFYILLILLLSLSSVLYFNPLVHNFFAIVILLAIVIGNKIDLLKVNINTLLALLTLIVALPLCISSLTNLPLLSSTTAQREFFDNQEWINEAIFVVVIQATIFYLFSVKELQFSLSDIVRVTQPIDSKKSGAVYVSMALMIISSFWANQTGTVFSGNYGSEDFYSAKGWFGGWPIILCISTAHFIIKTGLSKKSDNIFILAIVCYWLLHGNRSEVIVAAVIPLYFFMFKNGNNLIKLSKKKLIFSLGIGVLIISLFQFIGYFRNASSIDEAFEASQNVSESRALSISTIGPSAYTIVATIGLVRTNEVEYSYGKDYLNYVFRTFPSSWNLFPEVSDYSDFLIVRADAIGGAHISTEAYKSFGAFGVAIVSILLSLFFCLLGTRAKYNPTFKVFFVGLILYSPRVVWYGNIYLYKYILLCVLGLVVVTFLAKASR